jgi:UDP-N-acetylmuramyl pentapeptide phosphotransferase/UDP-N-acetylglucosamine-1-phosphate transferase
MFTLFFSFFISALMGKVILITNEVHANISHDHDLDGIQKHHIIPVPRIGGLAIFTAFVVTSLLCANMGLIWSKYICGLTVCLFFIFIAGIAEDMTKNIGPFKRLLFMSFGALIAIYAVNVLPIIHSIGIPTVDGQLKLYLFSAMLATVFLVSGVTNAFNLIDGYNGLASFTAVIMLSAIIYLANLVSCNEVYYSGLCLLGAILGFMIYNYPRASLFLGDGGAYAIGFIIAILAIDLSQNYSDKISPITFLLICSYPIIEVLFSIYRRKAVRKVSALHPDRLHMHQLVYYRCLSSRSKFRNSLVLPRVLWFILPQAIYSLLFYNNFNLIVLGLLLSVLFYVYTYSRLVKFRTPYIMLSRKNK